MKKILESIFFGFIGGILVVILIGFVYGLIYICTTLITNVLISFLLFAGISTTIVISLIYYFTNELHDD